MPIPSAETRIPDDCFNRIRGAASGIKRAAEELRGLLNTGEVPVSRALFLLNAMQGNKLVIEQMLAAPGVPAHAAAKLANVQGVSLDDFQQTTAALDAIHARVNGKLGKDADGYVQAVRIDAVTKQTVELKLPALTLKGLQAELDALTATIG